jgi:hypothetical protein
VPFYYWLVPKLLLVSAVFFLHYYWLVPFLSLTIIG